MKLIVTPLQTTMMKTKLFNWIRTEGNCDIKRSEFNSVLRCLDIYEVRNYSDKQRSKVLEGCRLWVKYGSREEEMCLTEEERRNYRIPDGVTTRSVYSQAEIYEMVRNHFFPRTYEPNRDSDYISEF